MKTLKFEQDSRQFLITPCSFGMPGRVGSIICQLCKIVECKGEIKCLKKL